MYCCGGEMDNSRWPFRRIFHPRFCHSAGTQNGGQLCVNATTTMFHQKLCSLALKTKKYCTSECAVGAQTNSDVNIIWQKTDNCETSFFGPGRLLPQKSSVCQQRETHIVQTHAFCPKIFASNMIYDTKGNLRTHLTNLIEQKNILILLAFKTFFYDLSKGYLLFKRILCFKASHLPGKASQLDRQSLLKNLPFKGSSSSNLEFLK
jgi:hypothetical protein